MALIRMTAAGFGLVLVAALSSCGPMPLDRAEQKCFDRVRQGSQTRTSLSIGFNADGTTSVGGGVALPSRSVQGLDPAVAYDQCVRQFAGQPPSRPLLSRPDWRG